MEQGRTTGHVRSLLRLEGLALFAAGLLAYARLDADWPLFAMLFLAPDASFAFYLFGPRMGAAAYNTTHSTIGPLLLGAMGQLGLAAVWLAHIGLDRALGYGLKYPDAFRHTHL